LTRVSVYLLHQHITLYRAEFTPLRINVSIFSTSPSLSRPTPSVANGEDVVAVA